MNIIYLKVFKKFNLPFGQIFLHHKVPDYSNKKYPFWHSSHIAGSVEQLIQLEERQDSHTLYISF